MKKTITVLIVISFLLLCSCQKTAKKTFFALDTVVEIKTYGEMPDGAETLPAGRKAGVSRRLTDLPDDTGKHSSSTEFVPVLTPSGEGMQGTPAPASGATSGNPFRT